MNFQLVLCEVRWVVHCGFSGNELPPAQYSAMGDFYTKEDAEHMLMTAGFTRKDPYDFWQDSTGYGIAHISRILREITPEK